MTAQKKILLECLCTRLKPMAEIWFPSLWFGIHLNSKINPDIYFIFTSIRISVVKWDLQWFLVLILFEANFFYNLTRINFKYEISSDPYEKKPAECYKWNSNGYNFHVVFFFIFFFQNQAAVIFFTFCITW